MREAAQDFEINIVKEAGLEDFQELWRRELGRKLGARGWLFPTYPAEYGGGLTMNHAIIIELEMERCSLPVPPFYNPGGGLRGPSILI